jgi:hypothetical protein
MINQKNWTIKKYAFLGLTLTSIGYSSNVLAQPAPSPSAETSTPKLEEILIPFSESSAADSAALTILGIPRSDVALPSGNPTKFGASLLESIAGSNGDFLGNFGVEIAPYWWFDNTLGFEEYNELTKFGQSILPTLSFSIAATNVEIPQNGVMIDSTRLGLGLRFKLLSGKSNLKLKNLLVQYKQKSTDCLDEIIKRNKLSEFGTPFSAKGVTEIGDCSDKLAEERDKLGQEIRNLDTKRVGWEMAFASGAAFDAPGDDWGELDFARVSASLITSYQPTTKEGEPSTTKEGEPSTTKEGEPSAIKFLGVTRYIYDDFNDNKESVFDLGTRVLWQIDEPFIVSAEYLHRFADDADDRLVGIFEYRFNKDYSLFASFGKDFDNQSFKGDGDLVTVFGINLGLGQNFLEIDSPDKPLETDSPDKTK